MERCHLESDAVHNQDSVARKGGGINDVSEADASGLQYTTACKNAGIPEHENTPLLCHVDWFHVFESMRQIAVRLTEEQARMEAVSIMNVILMTTDAYSEREKLGGILVFEAVALLLRKEAGLFCRKEAVHLLFLLLNCPNILRTFCSSCRPAEDHAESPDHGTKNPAFEASCGILEGLADCIVGCERGVKELILCRNAIIVLAFLASSGKLGLEIFLFHKLSKRTNFLGLILQVLLSEADVDAFESCSAPEVSKERALLLREALILLNRLASQPAYSAAFSQVLTSCRDIVSLAIEVANRLSKKSRRLLKSDSITRQMRESEVVELARIFKKRVFSFLGESYS